MVASGVGLELGRAVAEGGVPGILAEVRDGEGRWFGSAGVGDTETGRERGERDRFRIGSITKTFVATVVLQLVAEHSLGLDDSVEKWLPGVVLGNGHDGGRTTVRQLLDNTSGIFSYTEDYAALQSRDNFTPEQLVQIAMAHPAPFAPGTGWGYSSTNYILAGMVIERVTGGVLADEISRRITEPLGLTGTYLPRGDDPTISGPHSEHYTKLYLPDPDAEIYDATELDPSPYWAAGGMISTAGELNEFFGALLGGRILPDEQQRAMFTTVPTQGWIPGTRYGLGVSSLELECGTTLWGMGGAVLGSWSYAYGSRDGARMVAVNINADWAQGGWDDPIGIFTDVLNAEFSTDASRVARSAS
ncbi:MULTISPECIES: serine hydrolase domain-containing protein [unclassified Streptomyces]|uniref:serine hydrolase domain-containing protein n=1 Tax=unclassified Streptomyces TaxID=2593676 RepID=UPI00380E4E76